LTDIHHIGSTSVPGLQAKPVIDIMPVVQHIDQVDKLNNALIAIGYEPKGEYGLPGRRYFRKGGDNRSHHVHVYEMHHPDIKRHLAFRDYLRAHPDTAKEYGELKGKLALQFPHDMNSYITGKTPLVVSIEKQAMNCYMDPHQSFNVNDVLYCTGKKNRTHSIRTFSNHMFDIIFQHRRAII